MEDLASPANCFCLEESGNSAATMLYPRHKLNSTEEHLEEINKAPEWKVTFKNSFSFYFNVTINGK